jgi:hypothetical protein
MENAVAKIGRENHLNNLMGKLPLITAIFGLQCFFLMQMQTQINIGEFSMILGTFLIGLITSLYIYDKHHHVIIYQGHITIYFSPLNLKKMISLDEIENIIAPAEECDFSTLSLELKSKEVISLYFVDYPVQVKAVIEDLQRGKDVSELLEKAA